MRTHHSPTPWPAVFVAALLLACPSSPYRCDATHTCAGNAVCAPQGYCAETSPACASGLRFTSSALHPGTCVPPGDGGVGDVPGESGTDATPGDVADASTDLASDDAADVVLDTAVDAATDVAMDVTLDAPTDTARDLLVEPPPDAAMDVAPDAAMDVAPDAAMDATVDRPADIPLDLASTDLPDVSTSRCTFAPQLLGPLSATRLGGGGLRLRWRNVSTAVNAIIQVSSDASFTVASNYTGLGTVGDMTFSLPDLARGRYFWRVYGDCGTSGRTPTSATWSFWVSGVGSGGSAIGWVPDLDGDGFGDVAVGAPVLGIGASAAGTVDVYLSSRGTTFSTRRQASILGSSPSFGASVAIVPDLTGDGAAELVVGSCSRTSAPCAPVVRVYRVIATPGILTPATPLIAQFTGDTAQRFGADLAGVGDLDGDGYGDMLIAAPGEFGVTPGSFRVVRGGVSPTMSGDAIGAPASGVDPARFAWSVAGVGDVTGDGLVDALVTGFDRAWIYPGRNSASPPFGTPVSLTLAPAGDPDMGFVASPGGDLNGDGVADFVVGQPGFGGGFGSVSIFHGGAVVDGLVPVQAITGTLPRAMFGAAVAGGGDLLGGGSPPVDELLVGAPGANMGNGLVYVVSRLVGGAYAESTQTFPMSASLALGRAVAIVGDFDLDGFDDFAASGGGTVMTTTTSSVTLWRGNSTAAPSLGETSVRTGTSTWGYTLGER